jgi:hypothetical protein
MGGHAGFRPSGAFGCSPFGIGWLRREVLYGILDLLSVHTFSFVSVDIEVPEVRAFEGRCHSGLERRKELL